METGVLPPNGQLTMTVLMTPDMANFSGNVHGGIILKLLDQVAYACASRYAGQYVVTLSVDQVMFREPIHVGEMVTFLASVNFTGRTSMEVGIKVIARIFAARCYAMPIAASSPWWRWMKRADQRRFPLSAR
jgi:acyl-CoA hydrolase